MGRDSQLGTPVNCESQHYRRETLWLQFWMTRENIFVKERVAQRGGSIPLCLIRCNSLLVGQLRSQLRIGPEESPSRKVASDGAVRVPNLDATGQIEFRSEKCVRTPWSPG